MPPHVHLIASTSDLIETLSELLSDEGLSVSSGGFDGKRVPRADAVVIDALPDHDLKRLIADLAPVPVVVTCAAERPLDGAHCVLLKPFGVEVFLAKVAEAVGHAPSESEGALVHEYFATLAQRRWDDLTRLCHEDVSYQLTEHAVVRGRSLFRKFTEETFAEFRDVQFGNLRVFAFPRAAFATYHGTWRDEHGTPHELPGALRFTFKDGRVRTIGVDVDTQRLKALGHLVA
jgi:ketosteroid isomerase-like protein